MEEKYDEPNPLQTLSMPHFKPLRRACFVPFLESMTEEQKDLNEEGRIAILRKHFTEPGRALQIGPVSAGSRFQIDGIDWKLIACSPIAGILAFETEVCFFVLVFLCCVSSFFLVWWRNNSHPLSNEYAWMTYVCVVLHCVQLRSYLEPISALSEIEMLYARPAAASLKQVCLPFFSLCFSILLLLTTIVITSWIMEQELAPDVRLRRYLNPLRESDDPMHIMQGDVFMVRGVQFVVAEVSLLDF